MRILIVGLPKSGTTILTYRVAGALQDVAIDFEPADGPGVDGGDGRHVVTKKLIGTQTETLDDFAHYDRKIWIARDPRDFLVSQSLYRWHREQPPEAADRACFERVLARLVAKEAEPASVPFLELEPADYFETLDAVADLRLREVGDDWLVFHYEDMVDGQYDELNRYLGFPVAADAEVAEGLERVVRRKGYGDWRDWFTPTDVAHYGAGGLRRYLAAFGYDGDDWTLNQPQSIDPRYSSEYVTTLFNDHLGPPGTGPGRATATDAPAATDAQAAADGPAAADAGGVAPTRRARRLSLWSNRG